MKLKSISKFCKSIPKRKVKLGFQRASFSNYLWMTYQFILLAAQYLDLHVEFYYIDGYFYYPNYRNVPKDYFMLHYDKMKEIIRDRTNSFEPIRVSLSLMFKF